MALSRNDELRKWQIRIFATAWITYFSYYLCRYNMTLAKTPFSEAFSFSASEFGQVFSMLTIFYAVGQFVNGQLGDRFGARTISTIGALGSAVMNLCVFALVMIASPAQADRGSVLRFLLIFWGANGFFQAMGWPPLVRLMAFWFPVSARGKVMGLWGTCLHFGAAASVLLATFLTGYYVQSLSGDWRMVFLVPSLILFTIGILFLILIRNDPLQLGLPSVGAEEPGEEKSGAGNGRRTIYRNVILTLSNPYLWVIAVAFFLLDANRYGFVNWMPAYLDAHADGEAGTLMANFKKIMKLCIHPLAGAVGAFTAGWATDRFFGGRRAPVIVVLLTLLGVFSLTFAYIDPNNTVLVVVVVALVGYCTYGPHMLMVGHAAQDFGKKEGAAGAAGFIDAMGYFGATVAGWGAGALIDRAGYKVTFATFGSTVFLAAALVAVLWKVGPRSVRERGRQV
ncbi:MAG: MFS transporter [Candidatus Glassbacteria bacterium]|nr:MFS transporter [Candidatus Glassbacteria bacterium]